MNERDCIHCELPFDTQSFAKHRAGGKINECPDCVEALGTETAVKYLGLSSGDGKAAALSIVAFESEADKRAYAEAWQSAQGSIKGANGSLGRSTGALSGAPVRHVSHQSGNPNAKGRS